jgi:NAD(P)-dependent dehydrogenase (short-subunit alcohol dehydrogenase family)
VSGGGFSLGAATAGMLAGQGAHAVVADLKGQAAGGKTRFVKTDVTDEMSVKGAIDAALQGSDGLHGAINCAGLASAEKVLEAAVEGAREGQGPRPRHRRRRREERNSSTRSRPSLYRVSPVA